VVVLCAVVLALGVGESRAQDKVRVAVMNFENNSSWNWWGDNLGYAAQGVLTTALFESGQFSVIERSQSDALLAEQNLGASGRVTSATAAQVGQLLGV
jgi:curli biogenesis system outer membrane secretion channel CsgG